MALERNRGRRIQPGELAVVVGAGRSGLAAAKLLRLCPVILRGQGLCSPCRTVTLL